MVAALQINLVVSTAELLSCGFFSWRSLVETAKVMPIKVQIQSESTTICIFSFIENVLLNNTLLQYSILFEMSNSGVVFLFPDKCLADITACSFDGMGPKVIPHSLNKIGGKFFTHQCLEVFSGTGYHRNWYPRGSNDCIDGFHMYL